MRGNNKQVIFDDWVRPVFLVNSTRSQRRNTTGRIYAWAFMSNHFHLVLQIGDAGSRRDAEAQHSPSRPTRTPASAGSTTASAHRYWSTQIETEDHLFSEHPLHALEPGARGHRRASGRIELDELPHRRAGLDMAAEVLALPSCSSHFGPNPVRARARSSGFVWTGASAASRPWDDGVGDPQVSVYSGPEPPSGGVRRPPLAVIAPHWTQFDGLSSTLDQAVLAGRLDLVDLRRAHPRPQLGRARAGTVGRDADVVRLVVPRPVPREEDRRELVERERAVGRRVRRGAVGREDLLLGVALGRPVAGGQPPLRSPSRAPRAPTRARSPRRTPAACSAPSRRSRQTNDDAQRLVVRRQRRPAAERAPQAASAASRPDSTA